MTASPLRDTGDIAAFLEVAPGMRSLFEAAASLELPDSWIGAGLIRNAIWDALHGREPERRATDDVDVIYFDPDDTSGERDRAIEGRLLALAPDIAWSVKNQARMHLRNGDRRYRDSCDAIAHWPETATAIAARLHHGRIEVIAPHGIRDLLDVKVRPTPAFRHKMEIYRGRLKAKDWPSRWPRLTLSEDSQGAPAARPKE